MTLAQKNGGSTPQKISVVAAGRAAANALDTGATVNSDQDVFMVSMVGDFVGHFASMTTSQQAPRGSVMTFTYDPSAKPILDLSVGPIAPNLAQLGTVYNLTP